MPRMGSTGGSSGGGSTAYAPLSSPHFTGAPLVNGVTIVPGSTAPLSLDAIGSKQVATLTQFTDWLTAGGANGFIGEVGWDRTTDPTSWGAIGDVFYKMCDAAHLPVTYWASGEQWSSGYKLLAYGKTGTAVDTTYAAAAVIEEHPGQSSYLRGVNSCGGDSTVAGFAQDNIGTYNYDTAASFAYYAARGHTVVRIPFMWERLQPVLGAALNATALAKLTQAVTDANSAGLKVILDCHNYAGYSLTGPVIEHIGGATVTVARFTDLWTRLSTAFKTNAAVYAYGIMNEPHGLAGLANTYTQRAVVDEFAADLSTWSTTYSGAWTSTHSGAAQYVPLSTGVTIGESDTTLRDRSANGNTFWADVWVDSGAVGSWSVTLQTKNAANGFVRSPDGGWTSLNKGAVTRLVLDLTLAQAQSMRDLEISIGGPSRNGTDSFYILGVYQGDTVITTAQQYWQTVSQDAVTAIRANADTKTIMVSPYSLSGVQTWGVTHPTPWITDSANATLYEHHQYFDDGTGAYTTSYATSLTAAGTAGWSASQYTVRGGAGTDASLLAVGTVADARLPSTAQAATLATAAGKISGVALTGTPTSGQVPTATSGTASTWQTPPGGGTALNPYVVSIPGTVLPTASSATAASAYNASCINNVILNSGSIAINNWMEWNVLIAAGTYSLRFWYIKNLNAGIGTVAVDGTTAGTFDAYSATQANNTLSEVTGIALTEGRHAIRLTVASKNASSSNYALYIHGLSLTRTGA